MGYLASRLSSSSLALIEILMYQDGVEGLSCLCYQMGYLGFFATKWGICLLLLDYVTRMGYERGKMLAKWLNRDWNLLFMQALQVTFYLANKYIVKQLLSFIIFCIAILECIQNS